MCGGNKGNIRLAGSEKLCADFFFDFFAYCAFEAHLKSQFRSALNFNAACISVGGHFA